MSSSDGMAKKLSKKVALITGAGRGIGRAVALAYAREGADLVLCSRTQADLDSAAVSARAQGARVLARKTDVTEFEQVVALVAEAVTLFGGIDILVNNAGILGPRGDTVDVELRDWEETLKINLTAPFLVTRVVLKSSMLSRKKGCVINVSSGQGRRARAGWGPYAASKFGLEGLTQVWTEECRDLGVRFYTLNPGATRTAMRAAAFPEEDPAGLKSAEAVAEAFVSLAADDCPVPTGTPVELERGTGRLLVQ